MNEKEKADWDTCDAVFQNLSDFSGVRIGLYSARDAESVDAGIRKIFNVIDVDVKDKFSSDPNNCRFYKATHYQIALKDEQIHGSRKLANLGDLTCEIQVCTMMNHVWNEIEHDIGYKPRGKISLEEKQLLRRLGILTREGDEIIDHLISENRKRYATEDSLDEPTALPEIIAEIFGLQRVTFRDTIGSLSDVLALLNINKISKLEKVIDSIKSKKKIKDRRALWSLAQRDIKKFNTFLRKNGYDQFELLPNNSADPALYLIYEELSNKILKKLPAGRGKGRPSKIRSLASRYSEYTSSKNR